jgi:hypothetical protein
MKKLLLLPVLITTLFLNKSFSQDIRGGEVNYQINIYLYTQTSIGIDHTHETFHDGAGGIYVLTGTATNFNNDITQWFYSSNHIYPGNGTYNIYLIDSTRVANIQNISNSSAEHIALSAMLEISPIFSGNTSPVFINSQTMIDVGGGYISHNPMAYDADGDSLSFSLIPTTSSAYSTPPGITIDSITGLVQMPVAAGKYAINIQVDEWRRFGSTMHIIGTTYREMILDSSSVVGITEIESNSKLNFYPNPVLSNKEIAFTYPSSVTQKEIIINDINGKEIVRYSLPQWSSVYHEKLPAMHAGIYVARLAGNRAEGMVKFVVEKK